MNAIKGTPAYWKNFLHEKKLNGLNISEKDIDQTAYHKRCDTLNKNTGLVARHFQYRVKLFFKTIILDGPYGKQINMQFV